MDVWMLPPVPPDTPKRKQETQAQVSTTPQSVKFRAVDRRGVDKQGVDRQLLLALGKKAVMDDNILRQHEAIIVDTLSLPGTLPEVVAMRSAGAAYNEAVRVRGKQHDLGSPHLHVWAALVMAVLKEQDVPEALRLALQTHVTEAKKPTDLQDHIRHCRIGAMWNPERFKLQIAVAPSAQMLWTLLCDYLVHRGATILRGTAPKGPLVRKISKCLTALGSED
ncbi:unnamed protein product [Polarella glacialis]|uniref:Uncharacterized protein n=1 Tax=Polarella glacialis TaxID=89957 RepID=A0A813IX33_POLGL|nr:unnamed protein product [Polarella glacialis]